MPCGEGLWCGPAVIGLNCSVSLTPGIDQIGFKRWRWCISWQMTNTPQPQIFAGHKYNMILLLLNIFVTFVYSSCVSPLNSEKKDRLKLLFLNQNKKWISFYIDMVLLHLNYHFCLFSQNNTIQLKSILQDCLFIYLVSSRVLSGTMQSGCLYCKISH